MGKIEEDGVLFVDSRSRCYQMATHSALIEAFERVSLIRLERI